MGKARMRISHVSGERPGVDQLEHLIYALHRDSPYVICDGHPHSLARICKERLEISKEKALQLQPPSITAILISLPSQYALSLSLSTNTRSHIPSMHVSRY